MDNKKHELLCKIKDLASELGRTPSRDDFQRTHGGKDTINRLFGGWTPFVQASGLAPTPGAAKKRRIDNSIFERDLEAHLAAHRGPLPAVALGPFPTAAIISDIHWPFVNQRVVDKFYEYVKEHQPEWVILNGDAWDMYSHAKFPRSHNVFTPREEQALARAANEAFWKEVQRLAPSAKCVQMMGNHDIRPLKRIIEAYPEAEDWVAEKLKQLFTFDGVRTIMDPREELFIREDIAVFHGYRSQLGAHRDFMLTSSINGHTHRGGTVFRNVRGSVIFEANSGYAGDPTAKGLSYTMQKINDWTSGFTGVDKWGPRFVPVP